jgi:Domain of unknown function (DUF6379)
MFKTRVISDNGLRQWQGGVAIDVRLPWYRALPLSTVEIAEVKIDGAPIAPTEMRFLINGETLALDALPGRNKDWWYVLDSGFVLVPTRSLEIGSQHEVTVTIGIRPPYIPGFYRMTECTKRLDVQPETQGVVR